MSTCPEVLPLSSLALFVLAPDFTPNSLMVFTRAEPMARASIPNWAAVEQIHSPAFVVVLLISDLANTEKGEFRPKYPLVPLVKKRVAGLVVILGRTFKLKKYCFQVPQKPCFPCE